MADVFAGVTPAGGSIALQSQSDWPPPLRRRNATRRGESQQSQMKSTGFVASCLSWKWRKRSSVQIMERTRGEGHARRASTGDKGRAGPEVGDGEGTAEGSPPAGRVTREVDYFRAADHTTGCAPRNPEVLVSFRVVPTARKAAGPGQNKRVNHYRSGETVNFPQADFWTTSRLAGRKPPIDPASAFGCLPHSPTFSNCPAKILSP